MLPFNWCSCADCRNVLAGLPAACRHVWQRMLTAVVVVRLHSVRHHIGSQPWQGQTRARTVCWHSGCGCEWLLAEVPPANRHPRHAASMASAFNGRKRGGSTVGHLASASVPAGVQEACQIRRWPSGAGPAGPGRAPGTRAAAPGSSPARGGPAPGQKAAPRRPPASCSAACEWQVHATVRNRALHACCSLHVKTVTLLCWQLSSLINPLLLADTV